MGRIHSRARIVISLAALGLIAALGAGAIAPALAEQGPQPLSFAGGSGTAEDPYLVATAAQLDDVRNHLDAHFLQIADIELGVAPWNQGEGWAPIGQLSEFFSGSYDGGGYAIHSLTIERPASTHQGLFGGTYHAIVRDLRLTNVSMQTGSHSGALIGAAGHGTLVDGVSVTGAITSTADYIGGLVGEYTGGAIHNASASISVQGGNNVGGLVGYSGAEIRHSHTSGSVQGANQVGGLVGWNYGGIIADTYSHALVVGASSVGGLVGRSASGSQATYMFRSFSTGPVSGSGGFVGGLLGETMGWPTVDDHCYWDTESSGQATSARGEGRTTDQMQQQETYAFYNFYSLWTILEGQGYPEFRNLAAYSQPQPVDLADMVGSGLEHDPYLIYDADQLYAIRQDLSAHYRLVEDIDLSSSVVWDHGRGWTLLPENPPMTPFMGSLVGGGHVIRNMAISRPTTQLQGFFRFTFGSQVRDLRLENVNVLAGEHSGGLVGQSGSGAYYENISVTGQVTSKDSTIGGVTGSSYGSSWSRVLAAVDVQGLDEVGGIAGYVQAGNLERSYSMGSVTGRERVGGLLGELSGGAAINTYSRATVAGYDSVGGLVGRIGGGQTSWIQHSFAAGQVLGTQNNVRGLVGMDLGNTTVEASYWDTQATGKAGSAAGEGRTTAEMTHPYDSSTYDGWDWSDIWHADEAYTHNAGYPCLQNVTRGPVHVYVSVEPASQGNASGSGTYSYGSRVTVSVVPNEGWRLAHWTENGVPVWSDRNLTFSATQGRDLVAVLVERYPYSLHLPIALR